MMEETTRVSGQALHSPVGKLEVRAGGEDVEGVGRVPAVHGLIFLGDVDSGTGAARRHRHALWARVRGLHVTLERHPRGLR